jgi:hypothetical protein
LCGSEQWHSTTIDDLPACDLQAPNLRRALFAAEPPCAHAKHGVRGR